MKNLYKQKREQGFTIIEVMIVLAIAAVILLIVLLAVPALQRNSRNTQRNHDAASLAAAITTCLANHNNQITGSTGCNMPANVDYTSASQLTTVNYSSSAPAATNTTTANYYFNKACDSAGTTNTGTPSSNTGFAILFNIEKSGGTLPRCIDS